MNYKYEEGSFMIRNYNEALNNYNQKIEIYNFLIINDE